MTLSRTALRAKATEATLTALYFCATLQFVRFYSKKTTLYLDMNAYLSGHERLPFQERVLPILFIRPLVHSSWIARHLVHENGSYTADRGPLYLLSLVALLIAGIFVQKLYSRVSPDGLLRALVYPVFLFAIMWSYLIHNEADFSYPYDMLSVAFFTAGMYLIWTRRFWPLLLLMVPGTLNRETTLFLVLLFILDAASPSGEGTVSASRRLDLSTVPWLRAGLLFAVWLAIKGAMAHHFAHNDNSENYIRLWSNVGRLKPRLWPALLNICGYALPIVYLMRRYLTPLRFTNYLYLFPFWFAVMFYTGVIVETRVYGELCAFSAIALVLILEGYVRKRMGATLPALKPDAEVTAVAHREMAA